jgi:EpsI family protein
VKRGPGSTSLLVAMLVCVGAASWWFQLRPPLDVDAAPLMALPQALGSWDAIDVPLDQNVESILRADANLQRAYVHPLGAIVFLYVGYYGTERGGRPEHTPEVCFHSQGWEIAERRTLTVNAESRTPDGAKSDGERKSFRVTEFVVEQGGQRHLVQFWYRSHRSTGLLGPLDQALDRLVGRLVDGRSDGSLVRISTPIADGDLVAARSFLLQFAATVDEQLDHHWPVEVAAAR